MPITDSIPPQGTDPWWNPLNTAWENLKAFVNGLETALGLKASSSDLTTGLATKVNSSTYTAGLALKADLASPTFTGTVSGITKTMVGLGNVDNTADASKPVSTAQAAAIALKANLASPTFTGTVSGITKAMVGLGNVDNTADSAKPVSTAQAAADNLRVLTADVAGLSDPGWLRATVINFSDPDPTGLPDYTLVVRLPEV